jgi:2Fe-2S ferredoxin
MPAPKKLLPCFMTIAIVRAPDGLSSRQVTIAPGQSLMKAALSADVEGIEAECGGCLSCATCHVYVESGTASMPPPSDEEVALLEFVAGERRDNSRLSCQILGSPELPALTVQLPQRQV